MKAVRLVFQCLVQAVLLLFGMAVQANDQTSSGMADRVLPCTACHGKEGRATPSGYFPRIAGKPVGYLYNQLRNFREGRRSYPQMAYLLTNLTDGYLYEMAAWFSDLQLPYAPPAASTATKQMLREGEALARHGDAAREIPACAQCHGEQLTGAEPFIPSLLGLSADYLGSQLGAWRTGQRHAQAPDCMADIARRLTLSQVQAVAGWLAAQPVPGDGRARAETPAHPPLACGSLEAQPAPGQAMEAQ